MQKEKKYPSLTDYVILFMMFAVTGWLYETFLETVVYGWGFSNRGMLYGPYLPIYGAGGVTIIFLSYDRVIANKKLPVWLRPILLFVLVVVIATVIELATSYILEWLTGSWPWQTYEGYAIEFGGRIALNTSLRFGLIGVLCAWTIVPLQKRLFIKCPAKVKKIVAACIVTIISVETVIMVTGFLVS